MRLVFMGNGPFACPILRELAADTVAAVARPDRPQGKRRQIVPGPVTVLAGELNLPLYQPSDVNADDFLVQLRETAPDLLVVADFGQILGELCLQTATNGAINVHASLLPKYRGAAPVAWAIYHGERETGISIIRMNARVDAGGVLMQRRVPIDPDQNAGELEEALARVGAGLAAEAVQAIDAGVESVTPQDATLITRAPKLTKADGQIRWERTNRQVHDQVRAMIPWPIAFTHWHSGDAPPMRLQVYATHLVDPTGGGDAHRNPTAPVPGTVTLASGHRLWVQTGAGQIAVTELQPSGKRRMGVDSFLRGNPVREGDRLE